MRTRLILLFVLFLASCSPGTNGSYDNLNSGIDIQVFIGPMCPVVQVGVECPDQPYQASLSVFNFAGKKIGQYETDEKGQIRIPLPPGEYTLHPESLNSLPYAEDQNFIVLAGQYTKLAVNYDSGIR